MIGQRTPQQIAAFLDREDQLAKSLAAWGEEAAEQVGRWSPRWWSSEGWKDLAAAVNWTGDLSLLVAVFAELDPRHQCALEHWHGIGGERVTKYSRLGRKLPDLRTMKVGVTYARARHILWGAWERTEHKLTLFDQRPWDRLRDKPSHETSST